MNRIIVLPESKDHWLQLRHGNINSTEVSALFNCNPYITQYELYHRKNSSDVGELVENERMKWGNRLQDSIAKGVADDLGLEIRPMSEYIYDKDLRIGSSFDYLATNRDAIVEIKNVDSLVYNKQWSDDEAPAHIELQVQAQLLVSGKRKAYICALVGGNTLKVIERDYVEDVGLAILIKVAEFWGMSAAPTPNFEADSEFIKKIYNYGEPNKIVDPSAALDSLAFRYKELSQNIKMIESSLDAVKAEMLTIIKDAEKCKGSFYTISAGMVAESQVSFTRKAYRNFRINFKKEKLDE